MDLGPARQRLTVLIGVMAEVCDHQKRHNGVVYAGLVSATKNVASRVGNAGTGVLATAQKGRAPCCAKAAKNKCFFRLCLDRVSASKYYLRSIFEAG